MAVKIDYIEIRTEKRISAIKCEGSLNRELGEVLIELCPVLFEIGTPLSEISKIVWGKD
jgi:hypothetical protein